jgi:hypothetical protein
MLVIAESASTGNESRVFIIPVKNTHGETGLAENPQHFGDVDRRKISRTALGERVSA